MNFFKNLKNLAITSLIIIITITIWQWNNSNNKKDEQLFEANLKTSQILAENDTLKLNNNKLFEQLIFIENDKNRLDEDLGKLKGKIEGQIRQITKLKFEVLKANGTISGLIISRDSLREFYDRQGNLLTMFRETFDISDSTEFYNLIQKLTITGTNNEIDHIDNEYSLKMKPFDLVLVTSKIDKYIYKITASAHDFYKLRDASTIITIENPYEPTSFWKRWNIGLGIGISGFNQNAYGIGGLKYQKHYFGITYDGKNKGIQYMYFLKKE